MQQRKYVTVERSAHKEPQRASYETPSYRETYDTNFHGDLARYGSNSNIMKGRLEREDPRMKYSQLHKSPSESNFKSREEYVKGSIARRRGDGMVSNLKSQLQNLKMEVSKLMNKDTESKSYSSRKVNIRADDEDLESESGSLSGYGKDISDTISVTSEKIIDEPLRRLENKFNSTSYDHSHYMELESDLLKTELRNLKNKYNAMKQDLRQKCEALEKKNEYLEVSLRRSEEALTECKKSLEVELQTIKFQVTRKLQQQYEEEQKRSERSIQPVRDNLGENQLVQEKISKLYEQLSEKSRTISTMNMDLNDIRGQLEKKSFELKKELQKNNQLSKQFEFSKRENQRTKNQLQVEISKKMELSKTVQNLKQKINEMTKELHLHSEIAMGSEQLESKYSRELQTAKQNEQRILQENYELSNQIKKLKQLINVHEEQIKHLKRNINDYSGQVEQLHKNVKSEKEKAMEMEDSYRKMLDEAKESGQKQLELLQKDYDRFRESSRQISQQVEAEDVKSRDHFENREKDRQISRWKAEFKMLKLKYEEHFALEAAKKQEIESYYKTYKEYKSKNKILQMRNKVLEESATAYIDKIQKLEASYLEERVQNLQKINGLTLENQQVSRQLLYLEDELAQTKANLQTENERANQEQALRKEIEKKVLGLDLENNEALAEVIEKIKKRVSEQDEKINKYIKELKHKDNLVKELKKEVRTMLQNQQNELERFRAKEISECVQDIQAKTFACLDDLKSQSKKQIEIEMENNNQLIQENAKTKGELTRLQAEVMQLKEEVKSVAHLYNLKVAEMQQLTDKNEQEVSNYEVRMEEMEKVKNQVIKSLQSQIQMKNQQILNNRAQIKKYLTINKAMMEQDKFDEALKNQIEGSKKLREELSKKNEQVYRIRDSFAILKTELDNLKSESDIVKLKAISDKKNQQVQFDVETQSLKAVLSLEQKKVASLDQKIRLVLEENKKKDAFIQNYIMGKKLPAHERQIIATLLKEYEICLSGKEVSEKLRSESQELQKMAAYNFNLMKEVAGMKERLLLYEATSIDNSERDLNSLADVDSPSRGLMSSQTHGGVKQFD